jgi:hypothetical protein
MSPQQPNPAPKQTFEMQAISQLHVSSADVESWFESPVWTMFKQAVLVQILQNRETYSHPGCVDHVMRALVTENRAYKNVLKLETRLQAEVAMDEANGKQPTPDEIVEQIRELLHIQLEQET